MPDYAIFSIIAVFISLAFFFYLGSRASNNNTESDFWFSGRDIGTFASFFTWLASTIAFSYGILYYMQVAGVWGWYVFAGSILSYLVGLGVSVFIASRAHITFSDFSTIGTLIHHRTGNSSLGFLVDLMNAIAAFSLVYIEIGLGVGVFSALFSENPNIHWLELGMFFALGAIPYFYIKMGGFAAIVESDIWQAILIIVGLMTFLVFTFTHFFNGEASVTLADMLPTPSVSGVDIGVYLAFAYIVNIAAMVPLAGTWQRLTASSEAGGRWIAATIAILAAALVFACYVAIAGLYIGAGTPIASPADIFAPIADGGDFVRQVVYPLVFVGFVAALISSADSSAMSGILSLFGRSARPSERARDWTIRRKHAMRALGGILIVIALIHVLLRYTESDFYSLFLNIVFYLFSQLALAAPIVIGAALCPNHVRKSMIVPFALVATWTVLTAGFVFGESIAEHVGVFGDAFAPGSLTGPLSTTIVCLLALTGCTFRWRPYP